MFSINGTEVTYTVDATNDVAYREYEVAAWWSRIELAHGTYQAALTDRRGHVVDALDDAYWVSVTIPGVLTERSTPTLLGGVRVGTNAVEAVGELTTHTIGTYAFLLRKG